MLWLTMISILALHVPGALGAIVPQISPSGDDVNSGKGPYAITYISKPVLPQQPARSDTHR